MNAIRNERPSIPTRRYSGQYTASRTFGNNLSSSTGGLTWYTSTSNSTLRPTIRVESDGNGRLVAISTPPDDIPLTGEE